MAARLTRAFGAPVILPNEAPSGSLRHATGKAGVQTLVHEAGEAGRFTDSAVEVGVAGARRVLQELGMIGGAPLPSGPVREARDTQWVRASRSGICRIEAPLGAEVRKGERLGGVFELLGEKETRIRASMDGVVSGRRANPLVHDGGAVVHLARLD